MWLLKAQDSLDRHRDLLSPLEIAFIAASERALRMRQRRRLIVTAGLSSLAIVMAGLGIFAVEQRKVAVEQIMVAEKQFILAEKAQVAALQSAQRATLANLSAASAISPDRTRMLQIDPGGDLRIIDLATGRDISVTGTAVGAISAAIFSPDAQFIATGTVSGTVSIDDSALKPVRNLRGHTAAVTRLAFSPDGGRLASGSDDTTARFWSVESGALLWVITADSPVIGVAFSPDGRRVIVSSQNGKIYIANSRTGQIIR